MLYCLKAATISLGIGAEFKGHFNVRLKVNPIYCHVSSKRPKHASPCAAEISIFLRKNKPTAIAYANISYIAYSSPLQPLYHFNSTNTTNNTTPAGKKTTTLFKIASLANSGACLKTLLCGQYNCYSVFILIVNVFKLFLLR